MNILKTDKCGQCDKIIHLVKTGTTGDSYKWVTNPNNSTTWHCGTDTSKPVLTHSPVEV